MKKSSTFLFLSLLLFSLTYAQESWVRSGDYRFPELKKESSAMILEGSSPHFSDFKISLNQIRVKSDPINFNDKLERIIIVKEGCLKVQQSGRDEEICSEDVILLLPGQSCTISSADKKSTLFYVMSYQSRNPTDNGRGLEEGGSMVFDSRELEFVLKSDGKKGGVAYFDRGTAMCERLEMHITQLNQKGPSHNPHVHDESEIILILEGEMWMNIEDETYRGQAGDLFYAKSGEFHGVGNDTDKTCRYFAFKWK